MSAPKYQLVITKPAEADITDILSYTLEVWGDKQLVIYQDALDDAFRTLNDTPKIGRSRYGYLVYPVKEHKIFYHLEENTVYISRILHKRMDAMRHLP
jgi:toxin ParE1/3/4